MKNSLLKTLLIALSLLTFSLNSQTSFQWARNMGSNLGGERANGIATDASGNVYTIGQFQGVADFDPGVGTQTLSSFGGPDIFISKLDINGDFVWVKQIAGTGPEFGRAIAIDGTGNINITGQFLGTTDFDPNSGIANLSSTSGSYDVFILKLTPTGNLVWVKNFAGNGYDDGSGIEADATGNVFTTGQFLNTVDFDPSAATYTMNALGGSADIFISKLDAAGNFVWAKQFLAGTGSPGGTGFDISLDGTGNLITCGVFTGQRDFDPGAGTFTMTAINTDIFISKLDASGNFIWAKSMGGVSGSNTPYSVAVDASNNIYTTGYFQGTTDFDPGASTYTIASGGATDIFILKLDAAGNFGWAKQMGGTGSDQGKSITVSAAGDIYSTGFFDTTGDFDPSTGTYTLSCLGGSGVYVSKLDASGNFVWAQGFSHSQSSGNGISVTPFFDVYTAGYFDQTSDFNPGLGTYTLTPNGGPGSDDIFVHKIGQSICPTFSINSSTSSYTLMCAITSLTINAVNTNSTASVTYTWTAPSTATTTGSSYVVTAAGIYTVSSSATSNTCVVTQTLSIIQTTGNVNFNVNTTGSTCNNNGTATVSITGGTGPFTYTWSSGSNTTTASSLAPGTYSLTVKDANQCTKTNTFSILNTASTFSSVPICFVTVDSLSNYNVITWEKTLFPTADSFFVYRETGTNIYKKIASLPYSAYSQFTDTVRALYFPNTGDPNIGTYRYKMKVRDNCGNYSDFSPYHNTLFTINSNGTFSWSQLYAIEGDPNPVSAYILERDNLSNGNWAAIGSVSGTQSFIIDPNYATYASTASWRVRTQWTINCTPSQKTTIINNNSYSNRIKNNAISVQENSIDSYFVVSPNPSTGMFTIQSKTQDSFDVLVYNSIGQLVKQNNNLKGNNSIDLSGFAKGIYNIVVKANDNYKTIKMVIE